MMATNPVLQRGGSSHKARRMSSLPIILLIEAIVFAVAALIHDGLLVPGYEQHEARDAESVLATVLFLGFMVAWSRSPWAKMAGILTQRFALFGSVIGFFTIIVGLGPQSTLDIAYHLTISALLIWGLIVATRTQTFPKAG